MIVYVIIYDILINALVLLNFDLRVVIKPKNSLNMRTLKMFELIILVDRHINCV